MYDDPAGEFAPFGTDEGWDMLAEWDGRRDELSSTSTVSDILEDSDFPGAEQQLVPEAPGIPIPMGQVDAATFVIGAGFTLLRLTGQIDSDGKALVLKALDILIDRWDSPPELVRQWTDLQSWTGSP